MRSTNAFLRYAALAGVCAALMTAGDKKKSNEPGTVIEGTVFHEPGYALPDATVTLTGRDDPKHKKLVEVTTNPRGEFVIHVPASPAVYVVKASAKGYRAEEKEATVTGLDHVELMLVLEPEKKK
jgi:hypothetical protein